MEAYEFMTNDQLRSRLPDGAHVVSRSFKDQTIWHARYITEIVHVDILRATERQALRDLLLRIRDAEEAMSHD